MDVNQKVLVVRGSQSNFINMGYIFKYENITHLSLSK